MHRLVLQNGVHSKKILVHSLSTTVEVPVTAMRGRVNEASCWNEAQIMYGMKGLLNVLQTELSQLLGIKTNRRSFEYYRVAENLIFMRCVCT
jgi:hypothetical protein